MSNYTPTTNFAAKDALISGNPLKLITGTGLTTEFNNIATMSATKADVVTGTFTATLTGMAGATTATANYSTVGGVVTISFPGAFVGTSNTTALTMTGLPAGLQPATLRSIVSCFLEDNGVNVQGAADINPATAGTITFYRCVLATGVLSASGFTASAAKGLNSTSFSYLLT